MFGNRAIIFAIGDYPARTVSALVTACDRFRRSITP